MDRPIPPLKEFAGKIDDVWGRDLDSALTYAASGCNTAPPQMLGISADFFYDLVLLAKAAIKENA